MREARKLTSRYGTERVVLQISDDTFTISGKSEYHRCGSKADGLGLEFVDFEGGPFIQLNDRIGFYTESDDDRRIKHIAIDENVRDGYFATILRVE